MSTKNHSAPNRLINETSPYLLQHAHNPVDWYPWSDEALTLSVSEQKPIFLSIGYSACHWCHVMERESFENTEIASYLNEHFVCIKVDREERPDLDSIYMDAVTAMTGRGGWPMSVFLTPERRPFFGGTYWPPVRHFNMPGFLDVLRHVNDAWHNRRDEVAEASTELHRVISSMGPPPSTANQLTPQIYNQVGPNLIQSADREDGGFGSAPKFPHAMTLRVLVRYGRRTQDENALSIVRHSLERMARGGIYDQLAGGFHRYSTDRHWLVPHFEKMLYDQALLVPAYLEAWQATHDNNLARIASETLDFVSQAMTTPQGYFCSAIDADSDGEEGKYFTWSADEIEATLGAAAPEFQDVYGVSPSGNWEDTNVLHVVAPWSSNDTLQDSHLDVSRKKLLEVRSRRNAPALDDKLIVAWNGQMIAAFALGGRLLVRPDFVKAGERAADFIWNELFDSDKGLLHGYRNGPSPTRGFLDDYAAFAQGLIALYESTGNSQRLEQAQAIIEHMTRNFTAEEGGFFYSEYSEDLIVRQQDFQDNAIPSGNALAATTLLQIARLTGKEDYEQHASNWLQRIIPHMEKIPLATSQSLIAMDYFLGPPVDLILIGNSDKFPAFLNELARHFIPSLALHLVDKHSDTPYLAGQELANLRKLANNETAAILCEGRTCHLPCFTPAELRERIEQVLS